MKTNNNKIKIDDLVFEKHLSNSDIQKRIKEIGKEISNDFAEKDPILLCVLKGAIFFYADLARNLSIMPVMDFLRVDSYDGSLTTTGEVKMHYNPTEDLEGRHIIIIDEILDTGMTESAIRRMLEKYNPASLNFVTLLRKRKASNVHIKLDYCGFEIPDKFALGYGLDYRQIGRNLKDVYVLKKS